MPEFIPGLELSRQFFVECVQPVLESEFPNLVYDAALIGSGSEVLGFDTPLSRDHHWGPRVTLYVSESDQIRYGAQVHEVFRHRLPYEFRGYPTSFEEIPGEPGVLRFASRRSGPVNHRIEVTTLRHFLGWYLALDWSREVILEPADWLTIPQQKLRTLVAGAVYHAGLGDVTALRAQLAWYPHDVGLYLLAAGWTRISQEEAFVGRAGEVDDDIGSRLIAGRLVRDLMQLCFLMERQYAPYSKWFGTGFRQLACSALLPLFDRAPAATDWRTREQHLSEAYTVVAEMHNSLGLSHPLPTVVSGFHERPYQVIHAEQFASALVSQITDPTAKYLAQRRLIGSIDQFSDSTDLREAAALRPQLRTLYDEWR